MSYSNKIKKLLVRSVFIMIFLPEIRDVNILSILNFEENINNLQ